MKSEPQLLKHGSATHKGNVRDHNEDCYASEADLGLWLIADGMGGYKNGEIASSIARDTIVQLVRQGKSLSDAIQQAHQSILQSGEKGVGSPGMGTTIVAIRVQGISYEIAWVGDSRAYLFDGESLRQISKDHSYVQLLIDNGSITKKDAINHQEKNLIYQCLGSLEHKTIGVSTVTGEFLQGQKILLCSDGLNDEISDIEIKRILSNAETEQITVDRLLEAALSQEAKDNITVLLISAPDDAPDKFRNIDERSLAIQQGKPDESESGISGKNNRMWTIAGVVLVLSLVGGWVYYYIGSTTLS
jgi:protein phosphatase